jgi:hypothetical protein
MYLRQGEWCECERSYNTASGKFEAGVSVFECTVDLEPATMRHWAGYAWRLVLAAVVFWAIAHVGGAAVVTPPESASAQEGSR